jgi:hypothetical protein
MATVGFGLTQAKTCPAKSLKIQEYLIFVNHCFFFVVFETGID